MKILLTAINAKYIHSNLAVYSLKAAANKYDAFREMVEIAEFTINNQADYILEEIYKRKPDVLMFSCYIWNLTMIEMVMAEFHKLCPEVPIWLGGPEVSFEVETFLEKHPEVTGIMMGEGEETFCELCGYYAKNSSGRKPAKCEEISFVKTAGKLGKEGPFVEVVEEFREEDSYVEIVEEFREENLYVETMKELKKENPYVKNVGKTDGKELEIDRQAESELEHIQGIAYRDGIRGKCIKVNPWRSILSMSDIPFCYDKMEDFSNRIIYYESSRGCPFSCSYCLSSVDKKLRFRDLELVKEELQFFIEQKVPQVKFVDRTFNCHHAHAMEIWQYILEHDNGVTNFHFEISADLINEEELALMKQMRPGLIQLEIGVQSTNGRTIQEIKRTMKLGRLKEVVKTIKGFGNIHQHLDLIAGLPFEDYGTFQKSFDEIYALEPNQLQMGFLKVLKGSYMYEHAKEYGILYHNHPPYEVLATKWLSYEDLLKMKRVEEMLEVYYNSGQFEISMKILKCCYESAFEMFQKLGDFYEEKKLFGMSHSRIKRCEILMDFVESQWQGREDFSELFECMRQALVFDLYYRENSKSRPIWAKDAGMFKAVTHFYCKNGKMSHVEPFSYDFLGDLRELPKVHETSLWVLFSYDKRDVLTHQAKVEYVNPAKDMPVKDM